MIRYTKKKWSRVVRAAKHAEQRAIKLEQQCDSLGAQIEELENAQFANQDSLSKLYLDGTLRHIDDINCNRRGISSNCTHREDKKCCLVSIIIANRDGLENLKVLLPSIAHTTSCNIIEMILVDNNSNDDSIAYAKSYSEYYPVIVIKNDHSMSLSEANNVGAKTANGNYLLFMSNNTEVTRGWLDELLDVVVHDKKAGAIGSRLIYPRVPKGASNEGRSYRVQHAGIGFKGVQREGSFFIQPYNMANGDYLDCSELDPVRRAAVTAAVLLVSKEAFARIGGFDERYVYGYEDVDLCLKLDKVGYHNYCCPKSIVYHYEFGTQSRDDSTGVLTRRRHNTAVFAGKWQAWLSQRILDEKLRCGSLYSEEPLVIALVVTDDSPETTASDYFIAYELGCSLERLGYRVKMLSRRSTNHDWYDVGIETDVLISLLDVYDISKVNNQRDDLLTMAWVRDQFARWCIRPFFDDYNIVLASSKIGCEFVKRHSNHNECILFPKATNQNRYNVSKDELGDEARGRFTSDYAFIGRYGNVRREIMDCLKPEELPYEGKVFGANWENTDQFSCIAQGFVSYRETASVYACTRVLIDDANSVTKAYGSVNARVFDALAAGVLVVTNGRLGSDELFDGNLPVYSNKEELESLLVKYLSDEHKRSELTSRLREIVLKNHTYDIRAVKLKRILMEYNSQEITDNKSVDILGCMPEDESRESWGDYHFALALKKNFERRGYRANVVPKPRWHRRSKSKYIIVLRGLCEFYLPVTNNKKYMMWAISHPADITIDEMNQYDHVFFASERMRKMLSDLLRVPSSTLLQCTDPDLMAHTTDEGRVYELLFVGNSRGVYRRILKDLIPCNYNLTVFGGGWENYPVIDYVRSTLLLNNKIAQAYHSAGIVLNDHWDDMREYGIVSNRIFDALAAGACVLSDDLPEIHELFGGVVETYTCREDLLSKIQRLLVDDSLRKMRMNQGRSIVLKEHCFSHRVARLIDVMSSL